MTFRQKYVYGEEPIEINMRPPDHPAHRREHR